MGCDEEGGRGPTAEFLARSGERSGGTSEGCWKAIEADPLEARTERRKSREAREGWVAVVRSSRSYTPPSRVVPLCKRFWSYCESRTHERESVKLV